MLEFSHCLYAEEQPLRTGTSQMYTFMKCGRRANWGIIKDTNPIKEEKEATNFSKKRRGDADVAGEDASQDEALLRRRAELDRKRYADPDQRGKTGALKKTGACQTGAKAGWRATMMASE
jgi:streptomycin 6-kinase